jgi:hypothetical protein
LGSGQRPEGKRQNDIADAFGFLRDTGSQVFVRDKVQKPLFESVRAGGIPILRIHGRD